MKRRQRPAETLEADVIEDARILGEDFVKGFKSPTTIRFVDKTEFIKKLAECDFKGDEDAAYAHFTETKVCGGFDPIKNEAIYTLREFAPTYRFALKTIVHEQYGHGYIKQLRAMKELYELYDEIMCAEDASKKDIVKAFLAHKATRWLDEGFAYWMDAGASKKIKSDKERSDKYNQTRLDAWATPERKPSAKKPSDIEKAWIDLSEQIDIDAIKRHRALYFEIEKKFGTEAVQLAANACLDVPLDKIVDDEMISLYLSSEGTRYTKMFEELCSEYATGRLEAIANHFAVYSTVTDFEKKARELANTFDKKPMAVRTYKLFGHTKRE